METINQYLYNEYKSRKAFTDDVCEKALKLSEESKALYFEALCTIKGVNGETVYRILAEIFDLQFASLEFSSISEALSKQLSIFFINENRIIPLSKNDDVIFVAIDNPFNILCAKTLEYQFKCQIAFVLITKDNMNALLTTLSNKARRQHAIEEDATSEEAEDKDESPDTLEAYIDAPAVALANTLLEEAVDASASDIHIEPLEKSVRVRFRIDGVLIEHCKLKRSMYQALTARYKIMSSLDIAERRIPQDGKIAQSIHGIEYDFRVSTLPLIYGEKIVIRIFDKIGGKNNIAEITHNHQDELIIRNLIKSPNGIILLTGPTGSGKTTTLYTFLRELNQPGVNIQTVEDPVENQIPGINQLQTNTNTGLTFASSLRSILRQDPNIIMIGEIRDEETAQIAVQAAITGHLVFSTIHTNDAVTTITRLLNMGIEPYMVSDSLRGAISQRLVRTLCPHCKKEHIVTSIESKMTGLKEGTKIFEPCGCPKCNNTGYHGRIAVFEMMVVGQNVKNCISNKTFNTEDMNNAAKKDGLVPIKEKCADLLIEGVTSIDEFSTLISHSDNS